MLKVQNQEAQFALRRIFHTQVYLAHEALRCSKEDESLQAQDKDAITSLLDQLTLFKWAFHVALIGYTCQCIFNNSDATVIDDKENDCNSNPCAHAFEKSHCAYNDQDYPNEGIVNAGQLEPCIVQPFHQEG